eukprot:8399910-Prorocentrum_lima.AAC.1
MCGAGPQSWTGPKTKRPGCQGQDGPTLPKQHTQPPSAPKQHTRDPGQPKPGCAATARLPGAPGTASAPLSPSLASMH